MLLLFTFFFLSALAIFECISASEIQIGGLFTPLDENNQFSVAQAEHLAAFVMAVREINDKTDGYWDDLLPNTVLKYDIMTNAIGYQAASLALVQMETSFSNGHGVAGIVGSLPDVETMAIDTMAKQPKIPQVHSVATSTELGQGFVYPYKSQTVPIVSFRSMVFQSLLCTKFSAVKLIIIATMDISGVRASQELQDDTYCPAEILGVIQVESNQFDMKYVLDQIFELGGTVFAIYTPPEYTAAILEQGYAVGLFKEDSIFFSLDNNIIPHFSPDTDVAAVMTGYFGVEYWPNYTFGRTPMAIDFARRWSAQASTAGVGGSCDVTKDDEGSTYLYRSQTNASLCTGLDFSSYPVDGSTIADHTALTYEATVVLANALNMVIEAGGSPTDGDAVHSLILTNTSFEGITGLVEVFIGMPQYDYYGRGDREVGLAFKIVNFQEEAFLRGDNPMVMIDTWLADEGSLVGCTEDMHCLPPVFKTSGKDSSVPPSDTRPAIIVKMSEPIRYLLFACAAVSLVAVLSFTVFTWKYEKSKVVKAAQPVMLYATLLGGLLASARVFAAAVTQSDITCQLQTWFGHLAFALIFGSLFVKTYRVHKLVNTQSIKRVKFTANYAIMLLAAIVISFCVLLSIISSVGNPYLGFIITLKSNQYTEVEVCKMMNPEVQTAMFSLEFVMILVGLRLCYLIRNVYDSVNESNIVAAALVVICLVAAVVLFIRMPPATNSLIASIVFAAGSVLVLSVLFVPKIQAVIADGKPKSSPPIVPSSKGNLGGSLPASEKAPVGAATSGLDPIHMHQADAMQEHNIIVVAMEALKGMPMFEKIKYCNDQIHGWQTIQTNLLAGNFDSDNSLSISNTDGRPGAAGAAAADTNVVPFVSMSENVTNTIKMVSLKLSSKLTGATKARIVSARDGEVKEGHAYAKDGYAPGQDVENNYQLTGTAGAGNDGELEDFSGKPSSNVGRPVGGHREDEGVKSVPRSAWDM